MLTHAAGFDLFTFYHKALKKNIWRCKRNIWRCKRNIWRCKYGILDFWISGKMDIFYIWFHWLLSVQAVKN